MAGSAKRMPLRQSSPGFDHGLKKRGAENMSDFFTRQPTEMNASHTVNQNVHSDQLVGILFVSGLEACLVMSLIIIHHEK